MTEFWLDNHLSPAIALWLRETFSEVSARAIRDVGLRSATDREIFDAAFEAGVVIVTKDSDFERMVEESADGPRVVRLTCGNTSNARLKEILEPVMPALLARLAAGHRLTVIEDESSLH